MELLFGLVSGIIGLSVSLIMMFFRIILAAVAGGIASYKHRNGLLWGVATFIFPWLILILLFIPKNYPRFRRDLQGHPAFYQKNPVVASIMGLAAIVAKVDGNISREEIAIVKQFISRYFGMDRETINTYAEAFEYGKNNPEAYEEFARILREYYQTKDRMIAIAYLLVSIAIQGGDLNGEEENEIKRILAVLGISAYEYASIKNSFTREYQYYENTNGYQGNYQNGYQGGYINQEEQIKKYCEVLGVSPDASMADIKKAYRKLVKEYHPDKLASESMPEDYIAFANQKIREINEAYEYLSKIKEA